MDVGYTQVKNEEDEANLENSQPLTVKRARKALSDGSRADTPSPTYKHRWTIEQRQTLAMLANSYGNSWDEITSVFNNIHKPDLQRRGARGGLRKVVVLAQWNHMKKFMDVAASVKKSQATSSPYDRSKLVKKANDIGVRLRAKGLIDDPPGRKRKRADTIHVRGTISPPGPSGIESKGVFDTQTTHGLTLLPMTPKQSNGKPQDHGLLTPPDSSERKDLRLTSDKKLAPIGFRAFTPESQGKYSLARGIRAGAFLDCEAIPLAKDVDVTTYRHEALHHLTKHDHSRQSMFVSATKNPMRAFHMALRGGEGSSIAVIDLHEADKTGNVQKANTLKLETEFRYTAASEYLIFGGVDHHAIISYTPISTLIANIPVTTLCDDPFGFKVLRAEEKLSHARGAIKKGAHPMTYSLGRAVGNLVGNLSIPPKHFECGVWSIYQDYKFYSAEGGVRRGPWSRNVAFRDGTLQGYHAHSGMVGTLGHTMSAKEIVQIDDWSSDSDSSDQEGRTQLEVQNWVQNTQAATRSLQHFDLGTRKWTIQDEDLTDDFLAELKAMADTDNLRTDGDRMIEDTIFVSETDRQDETGNVVFSGHEMDLYTVIEGGSGFSSSDSPKESENIHKLCLDLLGMHGEADTPRVAVKDAEYGYCWTGM